MLVIPLRRPVTALAATLALTIAASGLTSPASAGKNANVGGTNVLITPSGATPRNELVVFLPGTGYTPGDSEEYLKTAADLGFHTIGLAYVNSTSANRACRKERSRKCHGQFRREVVYGDDDVDSSRVKVSNADSIVERLRVALGSPGFEHFKTSGGEVDWSKVIITGHSQGAGHAAVLGIDQIVARVVMLAGPNDLSRSDLPSWVQRSTKTDPSTWYGLTAQLDNSFGTQMNAWDGFGLGGKVDAKDAPTGGDGEQRLVTTIQADDKRDHESVVVDDFLARDDDGDPRLVPSWEYLLGAGSESPAASNESSASAASTSSTTTSTTTPSSPDSTTSTSTTPTSASTSTSTSSGNTPASAPLAATTTTTSVPTSTSASASNPSTTSSTAESATSGN